MPESRREPMPSDQTQTAEDVTVRALSDNVPRLRAAAVRAGRWLGADEQTVSRIALAISEAATNAVLHAFPERPGAIRVTVADAGDAIEIVVSDDGIGLTPRPDSPGLGLGLGLIAEVSDDLKIRRHPQGGTVIAMRFSARLPPEHP